MDGCPTFVHAAHLPPLPLARFVRAAHLLLTSSTCVRTRCRTLLVHTAVLHSYMLHICRYCRCLHSSSAINIVFLHSYTLQNLVSTHCCPTFVRTARKQSTPLTCVRTRCRTSLVHTAVLHSYTLHVCHHYHWLPTYVLLVCRLHRRPPFVHVAEARWYPLLSYIRTRCSYAVNTTDLRSYALQNLVGTHRCPTFVHAACLPPLPLATFVHAARLPSTSSTCVRIRCKTSLVRTAVLHSYALLVSSQHR